MQVSQAADTLLARDYIVNTLWFIDANVPGSGGDPQGLADDLADIFATQWWGAVGAREVNVDCYLHEPGDPTTGPPVATAQRNKGAAPATNMPRELALCLSFFATTNQPHRRGRIYLAPYGRSPIGLRPAAGTMGEALAMADAFAGLGGIDVDWVVHSTTLDSSAGVTDAWVDDEWDIQRRRGLRPTTRVTSTPGA